MTAPDPATILRNIVRRGAAEAGSKHATTDDGAAATPPPAPPTPVAPNQPSTTPAPPATSTKEEAEMAELAEAVNRLIVEIQTGFGRMEAKLDSLAAGKNDQLDDISAGIVDLKSTVSSLRSAVAGATGVVDTEMVEGAKSYLERPSTKTMSDDDKIMNTIKFLEAMFPDRSDDQRWASFEAANQEVK